jgi:hypothetical protein
VEALVRQALADRALLVRALPRRLRASPSLADADLGEALGRCVVVGARVDPLLALRLVDVGPAADDAKASAKFRWGQGGAAAAGPGQRGEGRGGMGEGGWGGALPPPGARPQLPPPPGACPWGEWRGRRPGGGQQPRQQQPEGGGI